jgi:hypothetical protein
MRVPLSGVNGNIGNSGFAVLMESTLGYNVIALPLAER